MMKNQSLFIIVILIGVWGLTGCRQADPRENDARKRLIELQQAMAAYHHDTGAYPAEILRLVSDSPDTPVSGWHGPYITEDRLDDPWRHPYQIGEIEEVLFVASMGPNGRPETSGEDIRHGINRGDDIVLMVPKGRP
jgi:hypothetical protein